MLLCVTTLLSSFRPYIPAEAADDFERLISSASYTKDLPLELSSMIRKGVFNKAQLIAIGQEIIIFCKETNRWFDGIDFVIDSMDFIIDSDNKMLLKTLFETIPGIHLKILFRKENISKLLIRSALYPDIFKTLFTRCQNNPALKENYSLWNQVLFTALKTPKSLSILWSNFSAENKEQLIHQPDFLLEASLTPESLALILKGVLPETYSSVITKNTLLHKIYFQGDMARLTTILSPLSKSDRFSLLSEKDLQGKNVLDYLKPEQRPLILNLLRPDIGFVLKEKYRLKDNATHFFSIGNNKKIQLIEESLDKALEEEKASSNDHKPITDNNAIKAALSHHRIFGFFGLKKTTAINHLETLEAEKSNKNFKS